jgi:hypothetical protein
MIKIPKTLKIKNKLFKVVMIVIKKMETNK